VSRETMNDVKRALRGVLTLQARDALKALEEASR
jgi:hypothetical protein